LAPHICSVGRRLAQTAGRSGWPKIAQEKSGVSCTHGMPAGLPCGIPGIGDEIEGAMQHAPHPERQSIQSAKRLVRPLQNEIDSPGVRVHVFALTSDA
jgi:hypothetical protein